jgi:hypothetical protein
MTNLSIRTLTRWLTPWRTIRRLETENQQLREQAVLRASINQELSILAESRRLKIEALAGPAHWPIRESLINPCEHHTIEDQP